MIVLKNLFGNPVLDQLQVICLMESYIANLQKESAITIVHEDTQEALHQELIRLSNLGLQNSKNYHLVENKLDALRERKYSSNKALEGLQFIKEVGDIFQTSFVISNDAFNKLVKKYKLSVGLLENYTGTIPETNITMIQSVRDRMDNFSKRKTLNKGFYVAREIESGKNSDLTHYLNKCNNIIKTSKSPSYYGDYFHENELIENGDSYKRIYVNALNCRDFFIACPAKDLKEQPLIFRERPVDPIVFQQSSFGTVIHTMWGTESEDTIIKNYIKYNNILSKINLDELN